MRVISGIARGTVLKTPSGVLTRPTADRVKEAMFSILQFDLPGATVLDLFAGTGQLGIEALSRGAKSAMFIDQRENACELIRENLRRSGLTGSAHVLRADYVSFLKNCKEKYQIILLDPPYAENFLENSLKMITEIDILQSGGIIVAEYPVGKVLEADFFADFETKMYKYGNTQLTVFRKND